MSEETTKILKGITYYTNALMLSFFLIIVLGQIDKLNIFERNILLVISSIAIVIIFILAYIHIHAKDDLSKYFSIHMAISSLFVLIVIFSFVFNLIYINDSSSFSGIMPNNKFIDKYIDFFYFSVATFATVGYGDIHPVSSIAKLMTVMEILSFFGVLTVSGTLLIPKKEEN